LSSEKSPHQLNIPQLYPESILPPPVSGVDAHEHFMNKIVNGEKIP